jgi:hypothetical protein
VTWDSTVAQVKDAEDWPALAKREAQERVSRVEAKSATKLASAREEIESLVQKITLLKGELVDVRSTREVAEETSHVLFDAAAEESERGCWEQLEELTLLHK